MPGVCPEIAGSGCGLPLLLYERRSGSCAAGSGGQGENAPVTLVNAAILPMRKDNRKVLAKGAGYWRVVLASDQARAGRAGPSGRGLEPTCS